MAATCLVSAADYARYFEEPKKATPPARVLPFVAKKKA
jgi:hypothetical protein